MRNSILYGAVVALSLLSSEMKAQSGPPDDLKWDAKLKAEVSAAIGTAARDPVNGLYVLRDLELRQDKPRPNDRQKAWLAQYRRSIQPAALEAMQGQFDQAAKQLDIRTLMILEGVARDVLPERPNRSESFEAVRRRMLHEPVASPILRVEGVSATRLDGAYREGAVNEYVLTPKPGFKIALVKATVTNVSGGLDSPLVSRFLGPLKMVAGSLLGSLGLGQETDANAAFRYIDQSFVFLVDGTDKLEPCAYIPERKDANNASMQFQFRGGGAKISSPVKLKQGQSAQLEFVFPVPEAAPTEYRLWVAGAGPVSVPLTREQP